MHEFLTLTIGRRETTVELQLAANYLAAVADDNFRQESCMRELKRVKI